MRISREEYSWMAGRASPSTKSTRNCLWAFTVGGLICAFAEGVYTAALYFGADEENGRRAGMLAVIGITALLTGIGVFDKIAKRAGAGTMVPISGFANSVAAPAMEFRAEGRITGTAAQMFSIAGPVIVYGCSAASLYGLIVYIFRLY